MTTEQQPDSMSPARIGHKQAERLLQLDAGYVVARLGDPYENLVRRGLVEYTDMPTNESLGSRRRCVAVPRLTWEGRRALIAYVEKHGRLEIEMRQPLSPYKTIIRYDPPEADHVD